ncbi:MAG: transcription-repair coupling factor [Microscillaceae bacterium]|nr:transcription-repair coupling factor [Microscillaceae bacterium]
MKTSDFLRRYQEDSLIQLLAEYLRAPQSPIHLKGAVGSQDAVLAAALSLELAQKQLIRPHLFILEDKESAAYFQNDLQSLLGEGRVLLLPASYRRPYQFEEVENANVLLRAEVLNALNQLHARRQQSLWVVTYPEALAEKVINKKSLRDNTLLIRQGEKLDLDFVVEVLNSYDFEKTDFVYEAGQFAVRGGILDIFSFSNDLPYRLEFFGNEIESIRAFHPDTQLSVEELNFISLIPNVHTQLLQEVRESFLEFIPENTLIWAKDLHHTLEFTEQYFEKVQAQYTEIYTQSGQAPVLSKPDILFVSRAMMESQLQKFKVIEFGRRFYFKTLARLNLSAAPQPVFRKNFEQLAENLRQNQSQGWTTLLISDSFKQIDRLQSIFEEIAPDLHLDSLPIALREGFIDPQLQVACYTDHQIFERYHRYKAPERYNKTKAITLKELKSLKPGDFVTHIDYGVGRFAGLEKIEVNGKMQEAIRLVYRDDDLLYINIHSLHKITKYSGPDGAIPSISKLGSGEWEAKKKRVKRKVQDIAEDLIELYAKRKSAPGFAFNRDSYLQVELESSFIYEDTPDQAKATAEVKEDMEQAHPMDRLICGDVGFGKTEVAIRAAFKAVCDSKQVAVLVPTTILAMQHYRTFKERLADFPCRVEYINRFRSATQIRQILKKLADGEIDILIGTHRLVGKDVKFKDLGLLVIDEEQKFGVKTKEKLKELRFNVDVLTLTATPIPRTLHFSLMGARDLSVIATPPPNRQPVTTELHTFGEEIIRDAISHELRRGGQVFFVHNRIGDIESIANIILRLVPEARIGVAHGQMEGAKLEKAMMKFIEGEYDVLISTNIIESGLDIPNANTIIINAAHAFGLSDLHQMRGRVGRSNRKAFCYLLAPPSTLLTPDSRKRLSALEEFSELGDGFKVAMRDLDIRGAGNLLGAEQSGYINDLGFETYHKILDDAIRELKETKFKDLFQKELEIPSLKNECNIETDLEILIPEEYVKNITERLSLYTQLDNITESAELDKFAYDLLDRFGPLPSPVQDLIETVKLRWLAEQMGFEKLSLKSETLKGYFTSRDPSYFNSGKFGKILDYLQKNPTKPV